MDNNISGMIRLIESDAHRRRKNKQTPGRETSAYQNIKGIKIDSTLGLRIAAFSPANRARGSISKYFEFIAHLRIAILRKRLSTCP